MADTGVAGPGLPAQPPPEPEPAPTTRPRTAGGSGPCARAGASRSTARLLPKPGRDPALDRLAGLAVTLLEVESAQIALLTDVLHIVGGAGNEDLARNGLHPACQTIAGVTAAEGKPLVLSNARSDARVAALDAVTAGQVRSGIGVPLTADDGNIIGALCVFSTTERGWSASDVTVLQQLASSVIAELERSALAGEFEIGQVRWELAADAASLGTFDLDLRTGELSADDRLLTMFGYERAGFSANLDAFRDRLHPDDRLRAGQELAAAIESAGPYEAEYRLVLPNGRIRWLRARGRALCGADGRAERLLGAAFDTTDARESQERVARVLEAMPSAFLAVDHDWLITYANANAETLIGRDRGDLVGSSLWERFPAAVGSEFETAYRRVVSTGQPETFEAYYPAPLDGWYEICAWPVPDGLSVYFVDVTERHRALELRELSASIAEALMSSLDVEATVRDLARLFLPRLGDWSIVSLVDAAGELTDLASWHVDPQLRPLVARYAATRFVGRTDPGPTMQAVRSAKPVITRDSTAVARAVVKSPDALAAILELAPETTLSLPLLAHGRVAGILNVCRSNNRPAFDADEIAAAVGIAERAGMALDNARQFGEQKQVTRRLHDVNRRLRQDAVHDRVVSRALQDAMTPRLPEPDHLHLVGRYLTASSADQVGGDWYDAILPPTGATTLMIGDVMGHDIAAAGMMGQLRNMLRAFAWDRAEDGPAALVARLDRAMHDLQLTTMATLAVMRIEQPAAAEAAGLRRLRWANAGHPRPILITEDGDATLLDGTPDPPVGVDIRKPRSDHTYDVPPGATLLMFTDGLVETRELDIEERSAQLLDVVREHHGLELTDFLDAVLHDMVGDQPDDDVAILAARFHNEARPRPAEAGPSRP